MKAIVPSLFFNHWKRMGKWIRQRFLLIAGRLIRSGRKFILKLSEDWAYKERNITRPKEGLKLWFELHRREKTVRRRQKRKGIKPFHGKACRSIEIRSGSHLKFRLCGEG